MVKKLLFVTNKHYPANMGELLQEKFELVCWNKSTRISKDELMEIVKGKFGIICTALVPIDKDVIAAAGDTLKVVATFSTGLDHLDIAELRSKKIRIGYVSDLTVQPVAEYTIALLLATSRHVVNGDSAILRGDWACGKWTVASKLGPGLYKSTVAVVGCGRIGISILKKLKPFDPNKLLYFSRGRKPEADELGADLQSLDFIMKESDFIIVALDLNTQTKGIINRDRINSMKYSAILINIGRGDLLDEDALIEALQSKKIAGAGLDVFRQEPLPVDSPLMKLDNVVLSPHAAGSTHYCFNSAGETTALNVLAVLNGTEMPAEVL